MLQPGTHAVSLSQRVLLHCPVEGGDPPPVIHWTKEGRPVEIGHRIQQLANGSLVIYDSTVGYCLHPLRGFAKKKNSKNPRLLWKWVGGSRSHSEFLCVENRPKIALNQ